MSATSNVVERHTDRRNGVPNQRPQARRKKENSQRPKPTKADLAEAKKKRKAHCDAYAIALAAAQKVLWDQAEALRAEFGTHDINYYYEDIIQRAQKKVTERATSRWNAYLKQRLELKNKGIFLFT